MTNARHTPALDRTTSNPSIAFVFNPAWSGRSVALFGAPVFRERSSWAKATQDYSKLESTANRRCWIAAAYCWCGTGPERVIWKTLHLVISGSSREPTLLTRETQNTAKLRKEPAMTQMEKQVNSDANVASVAMKLEVVVIPVSDV